MSETEAELALCEALADACERAFRRRAALHMDPVVQTTRASLRAYRASRHRDLSRIPERTRPPGA